MVSYELVVCMLLYMFFFFGKTEINEAWLHTKKTFPRNMNDVKCSISIEHLHLFVNFRMQTGP